MHICLPTEPLQVQHLCLIGSILSEKTKMTQQIFDPKVNLLAILQSYRFGKSQRNPKISSTLR